jgi:acetyltransferase-like isoleucine patch superfamily enzyme
MDMKNKRIPILAFATVGLFPGFLKKMYYRLKGYKIGRKVKFATGSIILASGDCEIGDYSNFGFFSMISCNSLKVGCGTKIRALVMITANNVDIGNEVIISETAIIRAGHVSEKSNITLENRVHIFPKTIIDPSFPILLKEECAVGFYTNIYTHGSYKSILDGYPVSYGAVTVGKRVELTYNVFVAPGVAIGDDTIVGYGSYVNKDLPARVLAAGCPAMVKRTKEEFAPAPSEEEKISIIRTILIEFCNNMKFRKTIANFDFHDDNWNLKNSSGKAITSVNLVCNTTVPFKLSAENIYVLFNCTGADMLNAKSKDCIFFDISGVKCSIKTSSFSKELRAVFSRYGIRFDTIFQ